VCVRECVCVCVFVSMRYQRLSGGPIARTIFIECESKETYVQELEVLLPMYVGEGHEEETYVCNVNQKRPDQAPLLEQYS